MHHLGCIVAWDPRAKQIRCYCHGGKFEADGKRIDGPPPPEQAPHKVEESGDKILINDAMNRLRKWLEDRLRITMFEEFGQKQLYKPCRPHSYAFTLGTAALVVFMTQVASGILLAMNYSSGLEQAVSVHNITFVLPAGWLIRAFHAQGSHLMVIILLLHMFRVFWCGGYKPRELTWLFGCGLLFLMLGFGFTGYLLPMDQVSLHWGTVVATESFMGLPLVGDKVGHIIRGGEEVEHRPSRASSSSTCSCFPRRSRA